MSQANLLPVNQVATIIATWDVMFPDNSRGPKQLALLTKTYQSRLSTNGVTPSQLKYLAGLVTDSCQFFPKISDILKARTLYGSRQPVESDTLQIADTSSEHDQTPEEKEFARKMGELTAKVINKKMTANEAATEMEKLIKKKKKFSGRLKVVGESQ